MVLSGLDIAIIVLFFLVSLIIGLSVVNKAGKSSEEFFLSGRSIPWWLLGISMVATTFSADTPNLVTNIVRTNGVAGNWVWWAFLLTGMLTTFVYARLWRRSGINTDLEFYELRYSGEMASFLRGFRSLYLGVFFNVVIMATVMLAGIKIGAVMLNISPWKIVLLTSLVSVIYTSFGGLRGVVYTDFFQFGLAMVGMIAAAIFIVNLPEIGSLDNLFQHEMVRDKIDFFPNFDDPNVYIPLLIIPIAVQWWSVWYPGSEPGGGGYVAQRMLSAKNENQAVLATLFFNVAHYALRPWPWIVIALASLIVFPDLNSIAERFPHVDPRIIEDDLAFPAMLTLLPNGLIGLLIASLLAALISTFSTHLNWGSSYISYDFYKRFVRKDASDKELLNVGRLSTVILMTLSALLALYLESALQAFYILLQIGAGTGLLFILRWFWWRINAVSEIVAMSVSFVIAVYFELIYDGSLLDYQKLLIGIGITTLCWVTATFMTKPTDQAILIRFYNLIRPSSLGWKPVINRAGNTVVQLNNNESSLGIQLTMMLFATVGVYFALFSTGLFLYGKTTAAILCLLVFGICAFVLKLLWNKGK